MLQRDAGADASAPARLRLGPGRVFLLIDHHSSD
jgi:hypothetical protein